MPRIVASEEYLPCLEALRLSKPLPPIQYGTAGSSGIRIYVDHSLVQ